MTFLPASTNLVGVWAGAYTLGQPITAEIYALDWSDALCNWYDP
jgi:hypothetical protein